MKNKGLLILGGVVLLLVSLYKEPNIDCSQQMGTPWSGVAPLTTHQQEQEKKLNSGWRPHNSGYNNPTSSGYETIEVIRENKIGPKTYYDIKHKVTPKPEIDLSDPYLQDLLEDETRR